VEVIQTVNASVFDIADFILGECGQMDTWKLQKLVYYCQAWCSTWNDKPLFLSRIEAWANGPVCPELYYANSGRYRVDRNLFSKYVRDVGALTDEIKKQLMSILDVYADKPGHWLRELTHLEDPWIKARDGTPDMEPCQNEITVESMMKYYGGL
jgi:uncharacterized phage-associated protein